MPKVILNISKNRYLKKLILNFFVRKNHCGHTENFEHIITQKLWVNFITSLSLYLLDVYGWMPQICCQNKSGLYDIQHNDIKHIDYQHNNTQHNDIQHNDTQHNETQHDNTQHNDTQHNDTQHNDTQHNDTQNNDT